MTNPAPAQADVPFDGSGVQFYNPDTVASAAGNWIPFTIAAGKGHWPVGKIPVLSTTGGAATGAVLQFDQIVTDNPASPASYLMATGKFLATDAFDATGGAVPLRSYKWVLANGTLTTTPAFTLANITANTDIKLNLYDGDLGGTAAAPTYFVGLNYCIANFTAFNGTTGWGANPRGGYRVIENGSVSITVHWWMFIRSIGTGNTHKYIRVDAWSRFWNLTATTIKGDTLFKVGCPNTFGPLSGATDGPATVPAIGISFGCDVRNGATLVTNTGFTGGVGGSNDYRSGVVAFPAVANGGLVTKLPGIPLDSLAVKFTSTGTMPGGLTSGVTYYTGNHPTGVGGVQGLYTNKFDAVVSAPGTNAITITSSGTGVITMTVLMTLFNGNRFAVTNLNDPIWIGDGVRPARIRMAPDRDYIFKGWKGALPFPYATYAAPAMNFQSAYIAGEEHENGIDLEAGGDPPQDQRIGVNNGHAVWCIANPGLATWYNRTLFLALNWGDRPGDFIDETSGSHPVMDNGPTNNGVTWPGLGSVHPGVYYNTGLAPASDGGFWGNTGSYGPYYLRYNNINDGSHAPHLASIAYLLTGHPVYLDSTLALHSAYAGNFGTVVSLNSVTYYRVCNNTGQQTRGGGWATMLYLVARQMIPDAHPEGPYTQALYTRSSTYFADMAAAASANFKALGISLPFDVGNGTSQYWMWNILSIGMLMNYWANLTPGWKTAVDAVEYKRMVDWYRAEVGGSITFVHDLGFPFLWGATNNTLGSEFASVAAVITNSKYVDSAGNPQVTPAGPDPWMGPEGNLVVARNGNMQSSWCGTLSINVDPTTIATIALCAIEMASVCGLPHSDNVVLRTRARVDRLGGIANGIAGPQYIARSGAV